MCDNPTLKPSASLAQQSRRRDSSLSVVATPRDRSSLISRNVRVRGRRTSVRLEPEMWVALHDVAARERKPVNDLVTMVEDERTASTLSTAIRVFLIEYYRQEE